MVWSIPLARVAALAATVLLSSLALSGCVSDTPKTQLTWFPKADSYPRPTSKPRERYARADRAAPVKPVQDVALNCPSPKPKPHGWYTDAAPPAPVPATYAAAGTLGFSWPLTGPIISDFGAGTDGGRNAGIDIAAPNGAPIHAAAAGQVSYAGNELRGYGNLVLIKHDDGYVTAYAHAERIVVNRGDYVQKGQVIGYAGQTGDVTSSELHFEIRKGLTPINPRTMLASDRAS